VSLTRRQFLWTTAAASLSLPALAQQEREETSGGSRFQHGVASGDPLGDRIILWTRVTPRDVSTQPMTVRWRIGADPGLRRILSSGTVDTAASRDYTVKVDAGGLRPGTPYYYAFDIDGEQSPVGRTKTFPAAADRMRFALVSCSNYPAGFFNVYASISRRPPPRFCVCGQMAIERISARCTPYKCSAPQPMMTTRGMLFWFCEDIGPLSGEGHNKLPKGASYV
jgi:alkaline phosphatase D